MKLHKTKYYIFCVRFHFVMFNDIVRLATQIYGWIKILFHNVSCPQGHRLHLRLFTGLIRQRVTLCRSGKLGDAEKLTLSSHLCLFVSIVNIYETSLELRTKSICHGNLKIWCHGYFQMGIPFLGSDLL